jgi:hypothetical protein
MDAARTMELLVDAPPRPTLCRFEAKAAGKPWPKIGDAWGRARHAINLLEDRWMAGRGTNKRSRYATRAMTRRAVHELIDLVALVSLHTPRSTRRDRDTDRAICGTVIDAMERACGCRACKRSLAETAQAWARIAASGAANDAKRAERRAAREAKRAAATGGAS